MNKISQMANDDIKFRSSIDGLWDIGIACALLVAGFAFLFDAVAVTAGFYLPIFLIIMALKQKVVYPRIGYVEHKGMNVKTRKVMILLMLLGLTMFLLGLFVYLRTVSEQNSEAIRTTIQNYGAIFFGIIVGLILAMLAKVFKISRFYFYGVLILGSFLAMRFVDYERIIPMSLFSAGIIILIIGVIIFVKFLNTYPKIDINEDDDNG